MILNVGCGEKTCADVNVDLFKNGTLNRQVLRHGTIRMPSLISNFVVASAEFLPFRDSAFNIVYCFHVIEHLNKPEQLLSEVCRVSKRLVFIKCPHNFSYNAKAKYHKNYFNPAWFHATLKGIPHEITVTKILNLYPDEIRVKILIPHF